MLDHWRQLCLCTNTVKVVKDQGILPNYSKLLINYLISLCSPSNSYIYSSCPFVDMAVYNTEALNHRCFHFSPAVNPITTTTTTTSTSVITYTNIIIIRSTTISTSVVRFTTTSTYVTTCTSIRFSTSTRIIPSTTTSTSVIQTTSTHISTHTSTTTATHSACPTPTPTPASTRAPGQCAETERDTFKSQCA